MNHTKNHFFSTFYIFVALHEATSQLGLLEFMETNSFVTMLVTPTPTNQMAYSFLVLALQQKKKITDMCYRVVTICIFDKLFF